MGPVGGAGASQRPVPLGGAKVGTLRSIGMVLGLIQALNVAFSYFDSFSFFAFSLLWPFNAAITTHSYCHCVQTCV